MKKMSHCDLHHHHSLGADAFSAAFKAKALRGGGLDADAVHRHIQGLGERGAHSGDVRGLPVRLGEDSEIYMIVVCIMML